MVVAALQFEGCPLRPEERGPQRPLRSLVVATSLAIVAVAALVRWAGGIAVGL